MSGQHEHRFTVAVEWKGIEPPNRDEWPTVTDPRVAILLVMSNALKYGLRATRLRCEACAEEVERP